MREHQIITVNVLTPKINKIKLQGIPLKSTLVRRIRGQTINISGVIPLLENHFLYLKIFPRNLQIDLYIHI